MVFVSAQLEGRSLSHKRVYRIYRALELNLCITLHLIRESQKPMAVLITISASRRMDFTHDQLRIGRSYWLFNVIDDYNRTI